MFSLFSFSAIFQWGSADPIYPYVRPWLQLSDVRGTGFLAFATLRYTCLRRISKPVSISPAVGPNCSQRQSIYQPVNI